MINLSKQDLTVVIIAISLIGTLIGAVGKLGANYAFILTFILFFIIVIYLCFTRDSLITQFFLFSIVVGFGELLSDYFGVIITETLVYPKNELFIGISPLYMPFSWTIMILQLVILADIMIRKWGLLAATIGLAILGCLNIPLYEFLANYAGFWYYQNTPMLFGTTPYYVILSETLLSALLPLLTIFIINSSWIKIILMGILEALAILIFGVFSYYLIS